MDEVKDQVQEDSPKVEQAEGQAPKEQSETTEKVEESKVYEDHLGRKLSPDELHKEYMKTQSYITKLEKERLEWEKSAQKEAAKAVSENDYLKNVDPNVREAIVQIVTPVIEDSLKRRDADAQRRAQDEAFTKRLDELEAKYKGGNGVPKFERVKVLAAMQDPTNSIFDPEWKFKEMNWSAFMDYEIKQAMKGKSSEVPTEDTGSSQPRKPDASKTPRSWDEAARSAFNRLGQ